MGLEHKIVKSETDLGWTGGRPKTLIHISVIVKVPTLKYSNNLAVAINEHSIEKKVCPGIEKTLTYQINEGMLWLSLKYTSNNDLPEFRQKVDENLEATLSHIFLLVEAFI